MKGKVPLNQRLVQKRGPKTTTYMLEDAGLLVHTQAGSSFSEVAFAFEQLRTNRTTVIRHQVGLLTAFCFTCFASFLAVVSDNGSLSGLWIAIAAVLGIWYFKTRYKVLVVQTSEEAPLEFEASGEKLQQAEAFLEKVFAVRNVYLISRWGKISPHLEYAGQLENLNWLLTNRILSKEAYEEKAAELEALFEAKPNGLPFDFRPGTRGPEWN